MKLVIVSHACVTPQNQAFFQYIAEASGWEVTIILPDQWKTDFKDRYAIQKLPSFQGRIIPVGVYFKGRIILHFYHFGIFKMLQRERPDVIYVHNEPYALSTFQIMVYNVLFLRRIIGFYAAQNIVKKYPLLIRMMERFAYRHADYGISVTESAAVALREKGFSGRLAILPLGVTENHLRHQDAMANAGGGKPFVIGYVGRLVAEKGVDMLLRSLALLRSADWRCQIIGEGGIKDDLVKLSRDLSIDGRTSFLGYVGHGEVSRFIHGFSVLVLPSITRPRWREQFGRVIIEALAAGVPVIGTNSGEIPFLIRKLQGGIVVEEANPQALAQAIGRLIEDPALGEKFAAQGKENVEKYFSERKIAGDFVTEIMQVVVARSNKRPCG